MCKDNLHTILLIKHNNKYMTFEKNKSAKELGIDLTRKFRVIDGRFFEEGEVLTYLREASCSDRPVFKNQNDKQDFCSWHRLEYADKGFFKGGLNIGDIITNTTESGEEAIVIEILNNSFAYTTETFYWRSYAQARRMEYIIKGTEEIKKMTVAEICEKLGYNVEIIKD